MNKNLTTNKLSRKKKKNPLILTHPNKLELSFKNILLPEVDEEFPYHIKIGAKSKNEFLAGRSFDGLYYFRNRKLVKKITTNQGTKYFYFF